MTTAAEETMTSLIGRVIVEAGSEADVIHVTLDDGRTLIFVGMGVLEAKDSLVH
jgi:phage protein D